MNCHGMFVHHFNRLRECSNLTKDAIYTPKLENAASKLVFTASALRSAPSENFTPSLRWKCRSVHHR